MKFEVELDDKQVFDAVVEKITNHLKYQISNDLTQQARNSLLTEVASHARKHADEVIRDMVLPGGITFRQHIENVITRQPNATHQERSRIGRVVDERLWVETERLFKEVVEPHMEMFKKQLLENLVNKLIK